MENTQKLFAFRVAKQQETKGSETRAEKWQVRDGVAIAGCSDATGEGDYRCSIFPGRDNGPWC